MDNPAMPPHVTKPSPAPMSPDAFDPVSLIGLRTQGHDRVDAHRLAAYRRFFDLGDDEPALALHWLLFTAIPAETREDGHGAAMAPFPALPYPRRMWGGGEVRWLAPLASGRDVSRVTSVVKAERKSGAAGHFLLAAVEHRIEDDERTALIEERQDVVFLPAAARPGAAPPRPCAFTPAWEEQRCFGPVDLFRYSALTLNGHRIHYDERYAREVERYAGLVVHGPLLAATLMQAGARHAPGRSPLQLAYRAVAPSIGSEVLRFVGAGEELAVLGPDDGVRMLATMRFAA